MKPDGQKFEKLARFLLETRPVEMSCEDWLDHVGQYADCVLAGECIPVALKDVERHMELCPECAEEFRALLEALRGE